MGRKQTEFDNIRSAKNVLRVDAEDCEIEDSVYIAYRTTGEHCGAIPTTNLEIVSYIRVDTLPEDIRQKVRAHLGFDK